MKILLVSFLVALGVCLTIVADIFLKKSNGTDWKFILIGILLYGAIGIPVAIAFKFTEFGTLFLAWEAAAVVLGIIVASIYYKEPFTVYRGAAFILALLALWL